MVKKKSHDKSDRTEIINFKVTPTEKEILEKAAEKAGVTVAQFVRGEIFTSMMFSGNVEVIKLVSARAAEDIRHKVRSMIDVFAEDDGQKTT